VRNHACLSAACCRGPIIRRAREAELAARAITAGGIKTSDPDQAVEQLSGGNQQKVVIARALLGRPRLMILDEPTRGIDIGAKRDVHALIAGLADQGCAVLLISSELPELMALADRLVVMRQGQVTAELDPCSVTQEEVLSYALPV
jgi:ABC-type sugar transport system ATPase subunit